MPLVMDYEHIIGDVEIYLARTGMAETTFGRKALNDGKAIKRLRAGKRMWPETVQKLRSFMAENPPPPAPAAAAPSPEAA
jgi:hypothetical protein